MIVYMLMLWEHPPTSERLLHDFKEEDDWRWI
jgi:hypothetical protein